MRHENEARSNYSAALPLFTAQGLGHKAKVDRKSRLRVCFRCDGGISRGILHQTRSLLGPLLLLFFFIWASSTCPPGPLSRFIFNYGARILCTPRGPAEFYF